MDEKVTLLQLWNRRVLTRGGFIVGMVTIPVVIAAVISLGGGLGLLPEGLGSLGAGPSELATGSALAAVEQPADPVHAFVALAQQGRAASGFSAGTGVHDQRVRPGSGLSGGNDASSGPASDGVGPGIQPGAPGGNGQPGEGGGGDGGSSNLIPGAPDVGSGGAGGPTGSPQDDVAAALNTAGQQVSTILP